MAVAPTTGPCPLLSGIVQLDPTVFPCTMLGFGNTTIFKTTPHLRARLCWQVVDDFFNRISQTKGLQLPHAQNLVHRTIQHPAFKNQVVRSTQTTQYFFFPMKTSLGELLYALQKSEENPYQTPVLPKRVLKQAEAEAQELLERFDG